MNYYCHLASYFPNTAIMNRVILSFNLPTDWNYPSPGTYHRNAYITAVYFMFGCHQATKIGNCRIMCILLSRERERVIDLCCVARWRTKHWSFWCCCKKMSYNGYYVGRETKDNVWLQISNLCTIQQSDATWPYLWYCLLPLGWGCPPRGLRWGALGQGGVQGRPQLYKYI